MLLTESRTIIASMFKKVFNQSKKSSRYSGKNLLKVKVFKLLK
nr:MAG TPA: hypothetical protein [Caudoviricetes sp.]